jgi:four helix bundle protein
MRDFRKLKVWEKSHQLTLSVYEITGGFPDDERFGLTSQMRRACTSIPTNIAEGCGRDGHAELARFLQIAMGSASELEYQLLYSERVGHAQPAGLRISQSEYRRSKKNACILYQKAES